MNKNIINKKVSLLIVNLILVPLLVLTNATLVHAQEIKAEWMRGGFGVGFNYRAGDEELDVSDVRDFDVQAAVDQASSIEGTGWVLFNLTSTAHGDRLLAPLPLLEEVNSLMLIRLRGCVLLLMLQRKVQPCLNMVLRKRMILMKQLRIQPVRKAPQVRLMPITLFTAQLQ